MNWKHSLYQIYAITVGQSFTVDEAYRLLHELREDRLFAIASSFAETKRAQAKVLDAKMAIREYKNTKGVRAHERRSEAALLETKARFIIAQPCLDMARVELAFIDNLIAVIDAGDHCSRIHSDFAYGSQAVQSYEYAYDYTWSLIHEGPHGELMRNVWINPHAKEIVETAGEFMDMEWDKRSREVVSKRLASKLNIPTVSLSITVKSIEYLLTNISSIDVYLDAHKTAMLKLGESALEQLSGNSEASPRIESPAG